MKKASNQHRQRTPRFRPVYNSRHWSECGRDTSASNPDALGGSHRSVLSLALVMRTLLSVIYLVALSAAAEDKTVLRLATLADIPRERRAALISNAITDNDSTAAISAKRQAYFAALKQLAEQLRKEYYWHREFPSNVFAGIDQRADALVAMQYPASPTTGASYVDMLRENYMNEMAEDTVVSMAREICLRAKESDVHIFGKPSVMSFREWRRAWVLAGNVKGGPKPTATLKRVRRKQDRAASRSQAVGQATSRTSQAAGGGG